MSDVISKNLDQDETEFSDEQEFELYIGKGAHLQGVFHVQGMARIDGYVEGEIHTNRTLQIGKDAVIVADIHANRLIARGPIRGDISAQQLVELLAPATVEGSINAPKFTLERGVRVTGTIKMEEN
ncbi:MAG: bactofilin family protein [Nitrospirales bacterium]